MKHANTPDEEISGRPQRAAAAPRDHPGRASSADWLITGSAVTRQAQSTCRITCALRRNVVSEILGRGPGAVRSGITEYSRYGQEVGGARGRDSVTVPATKRDAEAARSDAKSCTRTGISGASRAKSF